MNCCVANNKIENLPALTNGSDITFLDRECWRNVSWNVAMTFFETTVLLHVVKIITADDDGAVHLGRDDNTLKDATTDGYIRGERALLVDVSSFDCSLWGFETKTNVLVETSFLALALSEDTLLSANKDVGLLLECTFVLIHFVYFYPDIHETNERRQTARHQQNTASLADYYSKRKSCANLLLINISLSLSPVTQKQN